MPFPVQLPQINVVADPQPQTIMVGNDDIDSLYNQFSGGKAKDTPPPSSDVDVDALHKEFSSPDKFAAPPAPEPPPISGRPAEWQVHPPISGYSPQQSDALNHQYDIAEKQPQPSAIGAMATAPINNLWKNTSDAFKSAQRLTESGVKDVSQNMPAAGLGEIGLGMAGEALSPITGATNSLGDLITNISGNPDFGNKASMLATGGLPIAKAGTAVSAAMPTNKAFTAIISKIGPENLPAVISRMEADKNLSLADVSPGVRQMTQKLVTTEGDSQNQIEQWVKNRINAAKGSVEGIYNSTMGVPVNVLSKLNDLKTAAKNVGSKFIQPALDKSGPVDLTDTINHIDTQLKPGVNSVMTMGQPLPFTDIKKNLKQVRSFLTNDKSVRTDPKDLHVIQSNLRARADDLLNSSSGKDRQIGYSLMDVRNKIVQAIDKASGGKYAPSLSKYRDEKQIEDAFIKGAQITRNRPGQWDDRPEFWEDWVNNASKEQVEAAKEGARLAVDHQINGMRFGAKKGTDIPEVEFNKDKLGLLFGRNEVKEMATKLQNQKDIADTNSKLIQNSQTAMRMKADSEVDLPKPKALSLPAYLAPILELGSSYLTGTPGLGLGGLALAKGANYASNKFALKSQLAKNNALTKLITSTGDDREELLKILRQNIPAPKPSLLQRGRNLALPVLPP